MVNFLKIRNLLGEGLLVLEMLFHCLVLEMLCDNVGSCI
jgi:hypothetical protein